MFAANLTSHNVMMYITNIDNKDGEFLYEKYWAVGDFRSCDQGSGRFCLHFCAQFKKSLNLFPMEASANIKLWKRDGFCTE